MTNSAPSSGEDPVPEWVSRLGLWLGLVIGLAIICGPTPAGLDPAGQRLAGVVALMGVWWITQAAPMEMTSLLPLVLFPLLGIAGAKEVAATYFSDSSFLYLGGFILALGLERWGLHRRLALHIVAATGTGVKRMVFGAMLATFTLSMWISNTAATLMMLPIALALLNSLLPVTEGPVPSDRAAERLGMALMLGVGYSATLGGLATLVGTPTNIVFGTVLAKQFPEAPPVSAAQWMLIWTPCGLALLVLTWGLLTCGLKMPRELDRIDRDTFRRQLRELGPMSTGERAMLIVFLLTAVLWLTRTGIPLGVVNIPGWKVAAGRWLTGLGVARDSGEWINDSTVAMAMALLLFLIPIRTRPERPAEPLMDWRTANRLPWGILLLFGGGFAIAEGSRTTGLAEWSGEWLATVAGGLPPWALITLVCLLMTFLSEFTSNVATANALLPIVAGLAVAVGVDPRLLMLPATIAASNGYMLPIGTPPNAIVFGTGRIRMGQMMGYGFVLDLVGVGLIVLATYGLMVPLLGIDPAVLPEWVRAR